MQFNKFFIPSRRDSEIPPIRRVALIEFEASAFPAPASRHVHFTPRRLAFISEVPNTAQRKIFSKRISGKCVHRGFFHFKPVRFPSFGIHPLKTFCSNTISGGYMLIGIYEALSYDLYSSKDFLTWESDHGLDQRLSINKEGQQT